MPRVNIPVTASSKGGTVEPAATVGDPVNNHVVDNDGKTMLRVTNTNAAATARTLTLRIAKTVEGQSVAPIAEPIPAGQTQLFGPYDPAVYGNPMQLDVDNAELKLNAYKLS